MKLPQVSVYVLAVKTSLGITLPSVYGIAAGVLMRPNYRFTEGRIRNTVVRAELNNCSRAQGLDKPMSERHMSVPGTWKSRQGIGPEQRIECRAFKRFERLMRFNHIV